MRHVLIFAKTPYERTPYDRWLEGTGFEPVVLTTGQYAAGYGRLRHVHAFDDYDGNQLVDKAALRLARDHRVEAVFARAEVDVLRAAQLRDLLDLPGQRTASAVAFRNKVAMKDRLAGGSVEIPIYRPLDSAFTALEFIAEHGYPVVVKPVSESGSLGAAVLRTEADLEAYLRHPWPGSSQIETFVPGEMYHVDGLVTGGRVAFVHPSKYLNDCLAFRANEWLASVPVPADDPVRERLAAATRAVLDRLPTPPNTAFHAELWLTPDDRIVFCEIASRTGGAMVGPAVRYSFGLDLDREWLLAECGLPTSPAPGASLDGYRPAGWLAIPPRNGLLEHLPTGGHPDCVRDVHLAGSAGQVYHGGVKSGLFLAGYVVAGDTEDDVVTHVHDVATWFDRQCRWRPTSGARTPGTVGAPPGPRWPVAPAEAAGR
jgi:hypothetical protein